MASSPVLAFTNPANELNCMPAAPLYAGSKLKKDNFCGSKSAGLCHDIVFPIMHQGAPLLPQSFNKIQFLAFVSLAVLHRSVLLPINNISSPLRQFSGF